MNNKTSTVAHLWEQFLGLELSEQVKLVSELIKDDRVSILHKISDKDKGVAMKIFKRLRFEQKSEYLQSLEKECMP